MRGLTKVIKEERNEAKLNISLKYYTVTSGNKTWHWIKETGEFDATSWGTVKPYKATA